MMRSEIFVVLLLAVVVMAGQDQEITAFRVQALNNVQQPFNTLQADVYGHFHRSQTTLRIARQDLYRAASIFPYYRLTTETRQNVEKLLENLIYNVIDPTIEYVQKASMEKYYAFNSDTKTPVEQTFAAADSQLEAMKSECPNLQITSRQLMTEYSPFIAAINDCTRSMSTKYRAPINEFTRVHFVALPLINRIDRDLRTCMSPFQARIEQCVIDFNVRYCQESSCTTDATIIAVKDQAEKMVKDAREEFDTCLSSAKDHMPTTPSFLKDCQQDETTVAIETDSNESEPVSNEA